MNINEFGHVEGQMLHTMTPNALNDSENYVNIGALRDHRSDDLEENADSKLTAVRLRPLSVNSGCIG